MDERLSLDELLAQIKDKNDKVRAKAWQAADKVGAPAIQPLAAIAKAGDLEVSRSACRAVWHIVRFAGRPGAEDDRKATVAALAAVVRDNQMPVQLRRDVMWMLSEIVKDEEITPDHVARGFDHPDLREDVRAALVRIPGVNSLATLKMGFERASGEFKVALACSLRARGVDVSDPPCPKLVPTKETKVGKLF